MRAPLILHKKKKRTSHSGLCEIQRILLGLPPMNQDARFLRIGSELHARDLEDKSVHKLHGEDKELVIRMLRALKVHKWYQRMKKGTLREKKIIKVINGVKVKGHIDILMPDEYVIDLKTTVCESYEEFIYKANEYGYFRQLYIYQLLTGVKDVYIVAVMKQEPFKVMVLRALDYPLLMDQAKNEVTFLLWYFQTYGFPYEVNKVKHESKKHRARVVTRHTTRSTSNKKGAKNYFTFTQWKKIYGKKR